jgi:hypothetical protein
LSSMPATVTATSGITAGWSHRNDAPTADLEFAARTLRRGQRRLVAVLPLRDRNDPVRIHGHQEIRSTSGTGR